MSRQSTLAAGGRTLVLDPRTGTARTLATAFVAVSVGGLGLGLFALFPRLVGVSWAQIGTSLAGVPAVVLVGLVALWFAGLLVHVPVMTAAMPGLTARQALMLNLGGSAVSNVVPLGGPAGMGLGYAMARSWGFSSDRFASFTVATNLWNSIGKLVMGTSVLAAASILGVGLPASMGRTVLSACGFVALAVAAVALTFRTERATAAAGRLLDRIRAVVRPGSRHPDLCVTWLANSRDELMLAVRSGWTTMTLGVATYLLLQAALLFACLSAVGARPAIATLVIAFAIERLISLAPITPGASGVAELGTVAALHSLGVPPVGAAAGVLLYRILMFAVEIPVGGAIALSWLHAARRDRPEAPLSVTSTPVERTAA